MPSDIGNRLLRFSNKVTQSSSVNQIGYIADNGALIPQLNHLLSFNGEESFDETLSAMFIFHLNNIHSMQWIDAIFRTFSLKMRLIKYNGVAWRL